MHSQLLASFDLEGFSLGVFHVNCVRKATLPASSPISREASGVRTVWPNLGWDEMPFIQNLQTTSCRAPASRLIVRITAAARQGSPRVLERLRPGLSERKIFQASARNLKRCIVDENSSPYSSFIHAKPWTGNPCTSRFSVFSFAILGMTLQGQMWVWGYVSTVVINHFSLLFWMPIPWESTYGSTISININLQNKDAHPREWERDKKFL